MRPGAQLAGPGPDTVARRPPRRRHPSAGESLAGIASITVTQARLTYQD